MEEKNEGKLFRNDYTERIRLRIINIYRIKITKDKLAHIATNQITYVHIFVQTYVDTHICRFQRMSV